MRGRRGIEALAISLWLLSCNRDQAKNQPCRQTSDCHDTLLCIESECQRCRDSLLCRQLGQCELDDNRQCVAKSDEDCASSDVCKKSGACIVRDGFCVKPEPTQRDFSDREGCPCGCDRSLEMLAELGAMAPDEALATIQTTFFTIAEREDAGFITEAMVQHRLRLLAAAARLPRGTEVRLRSAPSDDTLAARDARRAHSALAHQTLQIRGELAAHGETVEMVRGLPKLHHASFRVWLELTNLTDAPQVLEPPALDGDVAYPIQRWYVQDGDGHPFDGRLDAHATIEVLVIGDFAEPVSPGTELRAVLRIDGLHTEVSTVTRAHWTDKP